ncbi:MAG: hypothetical protein MK135_02380 [Polyangiaceae bacterium]|nr:hypothetical protein [Polyangiaceae bacterium]
MSESGASMSCSGDKVTLSSGESIAKHLAPSQRSSLSVFICLKPEAQSLSQSGDSNEKNATVPDQRWRHTERKKKMASTPLAIVKEKFGGKKELIAAVEKLATDKLWLDRVSEKGLAHVSNAKLLRLHASLEDAKARFGSRDKLIAAISEFEKRTKDEGFQARLAKYPLPRLIDLHDAAKKRAAVAATQPAPAKKAKVVRSKKAKAKAAK